MYAVRESEGIGPVSAPAGNSPLADRLDGLLFFPVTAFGQDGGFDPGGYRHHLEARLADGPAAVFAACGTGEFPALAPAEYERCVAVAVAAAAGRVPVISGTGYGTALAREYAAAAERAGADGLLVLPPEGVDGGQEGLARHYEALAAGTGLDLILYQRGQLAFEPATVARLAEVPTVIGLKDGRGDLDLMLRIVSAVRTADRPDFRFFNGMPTAEMTQLAYRAIGVPLYSSAIFCFAPDLALAFHRAFDKEDTATLATLVDVFLRPYVELRRRRPGYAVSLVKAATRAAGHPVGTVRAPLAEPEPEHVRALRDLVDRAREVLA
ncbi:5-dehydro-4-deoxyglucarate dehydratase [Kitasatospora sp. NPDC087861]|uniref:5-dehydro-4-deoxyglucarate dehydratase n=1 Tax=Kitasatospora sp. NPDC087861 TaxID=3364070 RepID=UPI00382AD64E